MTANRCAVCAKPVNGASICRSDEERLERALGQIPALDDELQLTITRQTSMGGRNGSRSTSKPLPVNLDASEVADNLKATLVGWVRELEPDPLFQPRNTLTGISRWLMCHLGAIRVHVAAGVMYDEITYATAAAWRAIDRPPHRSRVHVSACLDVSCDGDLKAYFPTADYDEADESTHAKITCSGCTVSYPAAGWMNLGTRILHATEGAA